MLTGSTGCPANGTDSQDQDTSVRARAGNEDLIKVLLIGGSQLLQDSVSHLLDESRFAVRKCVPGVDQAVQTLDEQPGFFSLLIVQLFGNSEVSFFESLAHLKRRAGDIPIVLLAWPVKDLSFLSNSFEAGVDAYLESNISQDGFRKSLDLVVSGEQIFPSRMSPVLKPGSAGPQQNIPTGYQPAANPGPGAHLSTREIEILRHLANGEPNKVIANELQITEATVKVHVKGILRKIGAANRTQAAIWAIHNGLTPVFSLGEGQRP